MKEQCLLQSMRHTDQRGNLSRVEENLRKEIYHKIFLHRAIPCGQRLIWVGVIIQQNNDPNHSSEMRRQYFKDKQSACNGVASTFFFI